MIEGATFFPNDKIGLFGQPDKHRTIDCIVIPWQNIVQNLLNMSLVFGRSSSFIPFPTENGAPRHLFERDQSWLRNRAYRRLGARLEFER